MSNVRPISTALNNSEPMQVLAAIIRDRMDGVHAVVSTNRMYLIDSVHAGALYWLAKQFDVLGYKGWWQADTEERKRALIRRAIELHRYKGTPWAVKEAIRSLGYEDVILQERVGLNDGYYNGLFNYDSSHTYGDSGIGEWATFRVIIGIDAFGGGISQQQLVELIAIINEYKNVRSHLVGITFTVNDEDDLLLDEETPSQYVMSDEEMLTGMSIEYDGEVTYGSGYEYDETGDTLSVELITPPLPLTIITAGESEKMHLKLGDINDVDWGDGNTETMVTGPLLHIYSMPAIYGVYVTSPLTTIIVGLEDNSIDRIGDIYNIPDSITYMQLYGLTQAGFNITHMVNLQHLTIRENQFGSNLTNIELPVGLLNDVYLTGHDFNPEAQDACWFVLDQSGIEYGYAIIVSTSLEIPTPDGLLAIASLQGKGWTCIYE